MFSHFSSWRDELLPVAKYRSIEKRFLQKEFSKKHFRQFSLKGGKQKFNFECKIKSFLPLCFISFDYSYFFIRLIDAKTSFHAFIIVMKVVENIKPICIRPLLPHNAITSCLINRKRILITIGLITIGLITIGLTTIGLITIGLITIGLITIGLTQWSKCEFYKDPLISN